MTIRPRRSAPIHEAEHTTFQRALEPGSQQAQKAQLVKSIFFYQLQVLTRPKQPTSSKKAGTRKSWKMGMKNVLGLARSNSFLSSSSLSSPLQVLLQYLKNLRSPQRPRSQSKQTSKQENRCSGTRTKAVQVKQGNETRTTRATKILESRPAGKSNKRQRMIDIGHVHPRFCVSVPAF